MISLKGKTALITGGSRGIGKALVEVFTRAGAKVVTCGRGQRPDYLDVNVCWLQVNLSKAESVKALVEAVNGRLDILVNNAGIQVEKTVTETTDEDWNAVMDVNVKGLFMCCRALIPLLEKRGGSIINIGSISGRVADPEMAVYNASKAFVHGLTRSIAVDHGKQGVRCNVICPGWIMTEMAEAGFDLARDPQKAKEDALARHALQRFGQTSDIANMALWLASDLSEFTTGQEFVIDGGLTAASPLRPNLF